MGSSSSKARKPSGLSPGLESATSPMSSISSPVSSSPGNNGGLSSPDAGGHHHTPSHPRSSQPVSMRGFQLRSMSRRGRTGSTHASSAAIHAGYSPSMGSVFGGSGGGGGASSSGGTSGSATPVTAPSELFESTAGLVVDNPMQPRAALSPKAAEIEARTYAAAAEARTNAAAAATCGGIGSVGSGSAGGSGGGSRGGLFAPGTPGARQAAEGGAASALGVTASGSGRDAAAANSHDVAAVSLTPEMRIASLAGGAAGAAANAEDHAALGDWLIQYDEVSLGKTIGHSSFGTVNEGRLNGTRVAVKTIKRGVGKDANASDSIESIENFKKEARLNSKLRHPNIVLFMGVCVEPAHVCIVTELMERGNVRDLLVGPPGGKPVKLDWAMRLSWAMDTAMGVAYLHSRNPPMIHRDLKTTNLLVDRGMNVKICDFGLSRFQAADNVMSAVGTVQFAAPEVLKHEKYTELADVFSFGTVMWELHTRQRVFKGVPQLDVYKAVIQGSMPVIPKTVNATFAALLRDCWALSATARPSFREILTRLETVREQEGFA
ncbi:hypothetical protein BU14_0478s0002 [Porphyra umbilicalis]|uniref:Protein kinase domain-containing protein n=1 Tax=Porphyra umbilicalis TaxID=2786 RepID=A0A1X6NTV0_PORUM|nr:hypothetical protein BU14_0478s0002 [Porphyra umbilicalis]|eukprot:OSX72034.1 hypothetical protein BU14_0478s0002 [Porphyra umbilicalis]